MPIRLQDVLATLAQQVAGAIDRQVTDDGPDRGGLVRQDWGIAEPTGSYGFVAAAGMLYAARRLRPDMAPEAPDDASLLARIALALDYIEAAQRPSGLIDLRDCNYDSSPDAGFAVQALCPVIEVGRALRGASPRWDETLDRIETFVRRATLGMRTGGFHTPNHRWVMAGAMAYAGALFPDLAVADVIDAYLAEGFDIDADGAFIERSAGVYDAICDRSLMLLFRHQSRAEALQVAQRNLDLNLHLLNADGTTETGASRRQDHGTRPIPASMALPMLLVHRELPDPRLAAAAELLWERSRGDACGLAHFILQYGEPEPAPCAAFPFDFERAFHTLGVWRHRRGRTSLSAFNRTTRLATIVHGDTEIAAVKISQSYFGTGRFVGDTISAQPGSCTLTSEGDVDVHRPGYDMPLGRQIDPARWFEIRSERPWRQLPRCRSELVIRALDDGFDLQYRTLDGLPGVTAQVAIDFAPGGIWETTDTCVRPQVGQVLFLKHGYGTMICGHDAITVGPGADAHRMWAMRDAEQAPHHVRILMTFETPVDHTIAIRLGRRP